MMMLAPAVKPPEGEIIKRDITFVFDSSGSMAGDKIQQARDVALDILKPDYKPEPKYEDINIVEYGLYLGAYGGLGTVLPHHFNHLHILVAIPAFVGFFEEDGQRTFNDLIANTIREGHKVVARFVKD